MSESCLLAKECNFKEGMWWRPRLRIGNVIVNMILLIIGVFISRLMISNSLIKAKIEGGRAMLYSSRCKEILIVLRNGLPS